MTEQDWTLVGDDGPPSRAARHSVRHRGAWGLAVGTFFALVVAAGLVLVPLPYAIMSPGPITNTLGDINGQKIIDVTTAQSYPTSGSLYFTTVSVRGGPGSPVNIYDLLGARLSGESEILDEAVVFPEGVTQQQVEDDNAAEMANSQSVATAVALRALGQEVETDIYLSRVLDDGASAGLLAPGDVLVRVNDVPATDADAVRAAVVAQPPGTALPIVVRRDGAEQTVTVTSRDVEGRAVIGVIMGTRYDLPVDVSIHAGAVGGPSAGTMFALGIYDVLTPGELTGGENIAGTGTISDSGAVGAIGGIREKLVGAHDGGARWFLAPADNCNEVVGHVPEGLQVVRIATFDDALAAVEAIGAYDTAALPSCS